MANGTTPSKNAMDFLSKCLRYEPDQRITVDHALNHPFINPNSPQYLEHIEIIHFKDINSTDTYKRFNSGSSNKGANNGRYLRFNSIE
jgi:serine/threonine protein kinase